MFKGIYRINFLVNIFKHNMKLRRNLIGIHATPDEPLVDQKLEMIVSGLKPQQNITVKSSITEGKSSFSSTACFVSDSAGIVQIAKQESLMGSYTGIDGMGLFWSMTLDTSNEKDYRYMKRDVTTPQVVQFSIFDGHIPRNCNLIKPLFTTALHRWFLRKGVSREEIRIGKLRGTIFIPEGAGPFPGVIDVFSSVGGLIESRASLLASRGFVTYALPYFNFEDLPKRMNDMEFEYFKETVDWFSKHPMVMKNGIGTCGVSKGGELALMLAVQCPQVKAVVNVNGSPFCSYGPLPPFTDYVKSDESAYKLVNGGYSVKLGLTNNFTPDKMFKLWELDAKILYIVGEDDLTYDPMYADVLYKCYPEDQRHKLIIKKYPKAGHLIEPPYNPICVSSYNDVFVDFVKVKKKYTYTRDTKDFIQKIENMNVLNDVILVSFDASNMYTNLESSEILQAVKTALQGFKSKDYTIPIPRKEIILELVKIAIENNEFTFNDKT